VNQRAGHRGPRPREKKRREKRKEQHIFPRTPLSAQHAGACFWNTVGGEERKGYVKDRQAEIRCTVNADPVLSGRAKVSPLGRKTGGGEEADLFLTRQLTIFGVPISFSEPICSFNRTREKKGEKGKEGRKPGITHPRQWCGLFDGLALRHGKGGGGGGKGEMILAPFWTVVANKVAVKPPTAKIREELVTSLGGEKGKE